jgi:hypothetical protein
MRPLETCSEHGYRWAQGDEPCPSCQKRQAEANRLAVKKTKSGRLWPLSKSERGDL